jgi:uncharacterized protein with PhoU and TrkA domain
VAVRAMSSSPLLLKASAIAATDEEVKRHSINPKGVRHSRSLGDLVGLMNSGVRVDMARPAASVSHSRLTD